MHVQSRINASKSDLKGRCMHRKNIYKQSNTNTDTESGKPMIWIDQSLLLISQRRYTSYNVPLCHWPTDGRTDGQAENIMPLPSSLARQRHKKYQAMVFRGLFGFIVYASISRRLHSVIAGRGFGSFSCWKLYDFVFAEKIHLVGS